MPCAAFVIRCRSSRRSLGAMNVGGFHPIGSLRKVEHGSNESTSSSRVGAFAKFRLELRLGGSRMYLVFL